MNHDGCRKITRTSGVLGTLICLTILFTCVIANHTEEYTGPTTTEEDRFTTADYRIAEYPIFKNLEEILERIKIEEIKHPDIVNQMMKTFNETYARHLEVPKGKRKPYIVLNVREYRYSEQVTRFVAQMMGAKLVRMPPKDLQRLLSFIHEFTPLRHIFYNLCNYAVNYEVIQHLNNGFPVVAAGCWTTRMAFQISKTFTEIPPEGHSIYNGPEDILAPDMIISLNENNRKFNNRYMARPEEVLAKFRNPRVVQLNNVNFNENFLNSTINLIKETLQSTRDVDFKPGEIGEIGDPVKKEFSILRSLPEVLDTIKSQEERYPDLVKDLLEKFDTYSPSHNLTLEEFRLPFIYITGCSKKVFYDLLRRISFLTGTYGKELRIPTEPLFKYFTELQRDTPLRNAYYYLSMYAGAAEAKSLLNQRMPVYVRRYWQSQVAFVIEKNYLILPPVGSPVYDFPKDLLIPDLAICVTASRGRTGFSDTAENLSSRTKEVYKRFTNPKVHFLEIIYDDDDQFDTGSLDSKLIPLLNQLKATRNLGKLNN